MSEQTGRLALPLLEPGQAQKEMMHNEALATIDLAVQASVSGVGLDTPPASPAIGACWIVGAAPTGAWAGQAHRLAGWTAGGWRFVAPLEGMAVWHAGEGEVVRFVGEAWRTCVAIGDPTGGITIDTEARVAVAAILSAMRHHGLIAA